MPKKNYGILIILSAFPKATQKQFNLKISLIIRLCIIFTKRAFLQTFISFSNMGNSNMAFADELFECV